MRAVNANFVVTEVLCVCPNTALQIKFPESGFVCVVKANWVVTEEVFARVSKLCDVDAH